MYTVFSSERQNEEKGVNQMSKRYGLKGINDEAQECVVCGRVELKRVMWLVELDSDGNEVSDVFHVGTTCGARLLGYTQGKMKSTVDGFAGKVALHRQQLFCQKAGELGRDAIIDELHKLGLTFKERLAHSRYQLLKGIDAEAKLWADAQPIVIAL